LVFNAFTLLLPKLLQERLAGNATLLPLVGLAAFLVTLCGALTQFNIGRMIDRNTLKRVFLPVSIVLAPAMLALSFAQGWLVLPLAAAVAASIFGQVTVNDTMAARYISPALRARIYSVRFFVGFLGAAAAAPVVSILYERTGSVAAVTTVLAFFSVVTLAARSSFRTARRNWNRSFGRTHQTQRRNSRCAVDELLALLGDIRTLDTTSTSAPAMFGASSF
jgi:MFS family permease